ALGEIPEVVLQSEARRPGRLELQVLRRTLLRRLLREHRRCRSERAEREHDCLDAHVSSSSSIVDKRESPREAAAISCRPAPPYAFRICAFCPTSGARTIIMRPHEACQARMRQELELALEHHKAGRLAQAEKLYRGILDRQPTNPEALYFLGVLA